MDLFCIDFYVILMQNETGPRGLYRRYMISRIVSKHFHTFPRDEYFDIFEMTQQNIDSEIKLESIYQKRVCNVFLHNIVPRKRRINISWVVLQEYPAPWKKKRISDFGYSVCFEERYKLNIAVLESEIIKQHRKTIDQIEMQ